MPHNPLITNDTVMTGTEVLAAYHYQPNLERRNHLLKAIDRTTPLAVKVGRYRPPDSLIAFLEAL